MPFLEKISLELKSQPKTGGDLFEEMTLSFDIKAKKQECLTS